MNLWNEAFNNGNYFTSFLRIMSNFRGTFYCLSLATVDVDSNARTLKENGILLSEFAQNVAGTCFLKNILTEIY